MEKQNWKTRLRELDTSPGESFLESSTAIEGHLLAVMRELGAAEMGSIIDSREALSQLAQAIECLNLLGVEAVEMAKELREQGGAHRADGQDYTSPRLPDHIHELCEELEHAALLHGEKRPDAHSARLLDAARVRLRTEIADILDSLKQAELSITSGDVNATKARARESVLPLAVPFARFPVDIDASDLGGAAQ